MEWKGILARDNLENRANALRVEDLRFARNYLLMKAQEKFPPTAERIRQLNMIQVQDLWICQGRIKEAELPNEAITPIYLPGRPGSQS